MNRKTNRARIQRAQRMEREQQQYRQVTDAEGAVIMAALVIFWCVAFWMWL